MSVRRATCKQKDKNVSIVVKCGTGWLETETRRDRQATSQPEVNCCRSFAWLLLIRSLSFVMASIGLRTVPFLESLVPSRSMYRPKDRRLKQSAYVPSTTQPIGLRTRNLIIVCGRICCDSVQKSFQRLSDIDECHIGCHDCQ